MIAKNQVEETQILTMTRFWDVKQLATYLRVPEGWIYERTRRRGPGAIPHIKLGKYVRFDPGSEEFQKWLAEHRICFQSRGD